MGAVLRSTIVVALTALLLAGCQSGALQKPSVRGGPTATSLAYAAAETVRDSRYAGIVMDPATGEVLYADQADQRRHPASLAKMMTLYLLFEALDEGRLSSDGVLSVSKRAAAQPPSDLGLKTGAAISIRDAAVAIAVRSANDVAVAVAEKLAGSERAFVARMNQKARELGLRATHFENATGLPNPAQVTTARDMALLARALQVRFPDRYRVFSTREFSYHGRRYRSTNQLLGEVPGVDGIKTGYIRASGYNLAASVRRGGRRLIIIVMGGPTGAARDAQVRALINEYMPAGGLLSFR
jgi:D-alanyl-D-alanine carboxypeptidase